MNCQAFEQIVGALADEKLMDAAMRKSGLTHAAVCGRCAALLADERVLADGLRAFAESEQKAQAPPRLKQSLRAAFDQLHETQSVKPATTVTLPWWRRWSSLLIQDTPPWVLATAAILLLVVGATLLLNVLPSSSNQPKLANNATQTATPRMHLPESLPTNDMAQTSAAKPVATSNAKRFVSRRRAQTETAQTDLASNFIPLTYAGDSKALENGVIVRVEVPRTTLIAMGLPLDAGHTDENVKADLMMGENGVAYAIRLAR